MLPILVLMINSDHFVTNFGPKNHATWPFLSMPWALIRGWAIIQVWAKNRDFTVYTYSEATYFEFNFHGILNSLN